MAEHEYLASKAFRMPKGLMKPKPRPAAFAAGDPFAAATMPSSLAKPVKRRVGPASGRSPQTALTQMDQVKQSAEMSRQASLRRAGGTINKPAADPFASLNVKKGLPSALRGPGRVPTMARMTPGNKNTTGQIYQRVRVEANAIGRDPYRKPMPKFLRAADDTHRIKVRRAEMRNVDTGKLGVKSGARKRMEGYRQQRMDRLAFRKPDNRVLP